MSGLRRRGQADHHTTATSALAPAAAYCSESGLARFSNSGLHPSRRGQEAAPQDEVPNLAGSNEMLALMARSTGKPRVSNHEATDLKITLMRRSLRLRPVEIALPEVVRNLIECALFPLLGL